MNIYLDIDGVLLINEKNASPYASEFIESVVAKYPNTTHWLTTHCWQGEDRTYEILSPVLAASAIELLPQIKPTEWGKMKTDAIDFTEPFLWFDDDLYDEERAVLEEKGVSGSMILVDLYSNPYQLSELIDRVL